ncbi:MAG: TetR/AcrR family transcriptional regulator [Solirubrobacterales bacterium]|nr:TetR/AcrR family transcriptional regulator [Solirubrobacterales bacterium]
MTRLASGRTTHLEPEEIAAETLRLFDQGDDPSIRQLASALNVTPSAIYHHFDSRTEIVQAAVELVWLEILAQTAEEVGNPFESDPKEVLTAVGLHARRSFIRHHTIAPYMTIIPSSNQLSAGGMSLFANAFERLGVTGDTAGDAFHYYASYCFGTALYAASRLNAEAALGPTSPGHEELEKLRREAGVDGTSSPETRTALDEVLDLSAVDPDRDEELFVSGLKQILEGFAKV